MVAKVQRLDVQVAVKVLSCDAPAAGTHEQQQCGNAFPCQITAWTRTAVSLVAAHRRGLSGRQITVESRVGPACDTHQNIGS